MSRRISPTRRRSACGRSGLVALVALALLGGCAEPPPPPPSDDPTPAKIDASVDAIEQYLQGGDLDKAETIARRLTERAAEDVRGHELLGRILLLRSIEARDAGDEPRAQGLLREAGASYDAAVERAGDVAGLRQSAGTVWMMASEPDRALAQFEAAAGLAPRDPQPPLFIAQVLIRRGDHAAAEKRLGEVLAIEAEQPQALASLAVIELERGRPEEARALMARARTADPDDLALRVQAARIERRAGTPRRALEMLTALDATTRAEESVTAELAAAWEALDEPAEAARAWVHRFRYQPNGDWRAAASAGTMWHRAGEAEEARAWLNQARLMAPNAPEVLELERTLGG